MIVPPRRSIMLLLLSSFAWMAWLFSPWLGDPILRAGLLLVAATSLVAVLTLTSSRVVGAVAIFVGYVAFRLVYVVGSSFQLLPFGDSYWDLAVVRAFVAEGAVRVFPGSDSVAMQMTWYSSWPLLHALTASLSTALRLDPLTTAYVMLYWLSLAGFLSGAVLAVRLCHGLSLPNRAASLALLFLAMFPEGMFWSMSFVRQTYAFPIFLLLLFVLLLIWTDAARPAWIGMGFLLMAGLALGHHFSAFTFLILLTFAIVAADLASRSRVKSLNLGIRPPPRIFTIVLIGLLLTLTWWTTVADVIFPHVGSLIARYARVFSQGDADLYNPTSVSVPAEWRPAWFRAALLYREVAVYGAAMLGGVLLLLLARRGANAPARSYYLSFLAAYAALFVVFLFWTEPFRLVAMSAPFVAVAWAALIEEILAKRQSFRIAAAAGLSALLICSGILLWAHTYSPIHLGEPAREWDTSTGEHSLEGLVVADHVARFALAREGRMLADDVNPLAARLSYDDLTRLKRLAPDAETVLRPGPIVNTIIVVAARDLYTYEYYSSKWGTVESPAAAEELRISLIQRFESADQLYESDAGGVWRLSGTLDEP